MAGLSFPFIFSLSLIQEGRVLRTGKELNGELGLFELVTDYFSKLSASKSGMTFRMTLSLCILFLFSLKAVRGRKVF